VHLVQSEAACGGALCGLWADDVVAWPREAQAEMRSLPEGVESPIQERMEKATMTRKEKWLVGLIITLVIGVVWTLTWLWWSTLVRVAL